MTFRLVVDRRVLYLRKLGGLLLGTVSSPGRRVNLFLSPNQLHPNIQHLNPKQRAAYNAQTKLLASSIYPEKSHGKGRPKANESAHRGHWNRVIAFVVVGAIVFVAVAESAHSDFDSVAAHSDAAEARAAFVADSRCGAASPAGAGRAVLFAVPASKPAESAPPPESVAGSWWLGRRQLPSTAARSPFRQGSVTESLPLTSAGPYAGAGLLRRAPLAGRH